ncbi:hypothetical protein AB0O05_02695 [Streptomyces sp. NPDC093084]|uniref:hypothetical protein n=1 Tax=Streptomyces sp. NPDC093084 TaxID=3155197 RepID=UPI00343E4C60
MTTAPHRAYRLVDPSPDALVFPAQRVRPGTPAGVLPRLSDNVWRLSFLDHLDTASSRTFSWWDVPEPLRAPLKRTAYAVLHLPAPAILMERGYTATRPVLSASSFHKTLRAWRDFARWLAGHNIVRLQDADAQVLEAYARKVATAAGGVRQRRRQLFELTRAWAYAPFLPAGDRLVIPPWEDDGAAIRDFFDTQDLEEGECGTPVIHPATMSPLLVWSLRMVTDLAPDITTSLREWRRLAANTAATSTPEGSERLRTFCHALRAADGAFPTYAGVQRAAYDRHTNRRPPLARAYLAGLLAIPPATIDNLLMREPALLDGIRFSPGAPLDIRLTGRIDGKPWRESIDHADAVQFAVHLATAAMITIAYLSGMRPAEVLHLRRGCAVREERADGTVRHTLTGRHFKNVLDADGATKPAGEIRPEPWTVIELVHRAVTVLGDLSTDDLLFPRSLSANPHARQQAHGGAAISTHTANNRITYFAAFANCLAESLGRDHEMIPDDPAGLLVISYYTSISVA